MQLDIEIRDIAEENPLTGEKYSYVQIVIYELEMGDNNEPIRFVRDVYNADNYVSAVEVLQELLKDN